MTRSPADSGAAGGRSVLLVSQYAPPSNLVGARRTAGMAKYLSRLGYELTVLTSGFSGEGPCEGAARVIRTGDLMSSRLNWRRRHLTAMEGQSAGAYSEASRLASVVVPDLGLVTWIPYAIPAALRAARETRAELVLTTSPPQSVHLIGRALQRRGLAWLADLRDGWRFEPSHADWPTSPQRAIDRALERYVARHADAITAVTRPISDDLSVRLGVGAACVTNGFDPDEYPQRFDPTGLLDPERISLVHTGRLASERRSLDPLGRALTLIGERDAAPAGRIEIVLAGPLTEAEQRRLSQPPFAGVVRSVGMLERPRALALQREADALLLILEGERTSMASGKLFEYLGSRRPVLVIGDHSEAARIVADAQAGIACSATDPGSIADGLARIAGDAPQPAAGGLERYAYPHVAEQMAEQIERAVSVAAGRR